MNVCLTIPVYNEREQIEASIRSLLAKAPQWGAFALQIVVADNGSNDGTAEIAERLSSTLPNVQHLALERKGRGRALKEAWTKSDSEILAYMDVDLSTDLSFFPALIEPLARGKSDLSIGSRLLQPGWTQRGFKREFISRCYNKLLRKVFGRQRGAAAAGLNVSTGASLYRGISFSDAQCGFKAITKKAATELLPLVEDNEWFFDTELLLLAECLGYRIHDLPVKWKDDSDSRVKIVSTIIKDLKAIVRMRRRFREIKRINDTKHPGTERENARDDYRSLTVVR
jgi:glycosyltransferase involved in cell wall biosynthesis